MDSAQENEMIQYLLGRLTEQERAELEDRFLADDTFFEELLTVEEDLRDAFTRGELSASDRQAFKHTLLRTPKQLWQQEFARALQHNKPQSTTVRPPNVRESRWKYALRFLQRRPILVTAVSTAMIVAVVVGTWSIHGGVGPSGSTPRETASQSKSGVAPEQQATNTVELELKGDEVRSSGQEMPSLLIPPGVTQIRLEAPVEGNYAQYDAILRTVAGARVGSYANLESQNTPTGKKVDVVLPANLLPPEDYILTLKKSSFAEPHPIVAEYSFRIKK